MNVLSRSVLLGLLLVCLWSREVAAFRPDQSIAVIAEKDTPTIDDDFVTQEDNKELPSPKCSKSTSLALSVRGGGVVGFLWKNPLLIVLMAATTALKVYEEQVPFSKYLSGLLQFAIAAYVFYLLTQWQASLEATSEK